MQIESIYEKGTGVINEDFHFINGSIFGVLDGATSLTPVTYEKGLTGGFLASNIAGEIFQKNDDSLLTLAEEANFAICEAMLERGVNVDEKGHLWCASAAVVRLEGDTLEWVQIGDSLVLVIYDDGTHEIVCDKSEQDIETLKQWKAIADTTHHPIATAMKDQIFKVRSQMNVAYGVLSGEKDALSFLSYGKKQIKNISNILIFTDGLFLPKSDPESGEDFHLLAELFLEGGLSRVRDYIRQIEETDIACRIYPRFKTHDDIAAISITL
ncbi:protein phosphatase 2C domain-containing protein [Maridesulfovibrio frigidus]|uniref:protein phosphatase 2C domain-containing protein n=1 Tax=Maridesulfovibrio frigidus TaxID=340956 RepID=UPI0004E13330|nr:protein phosphatase 2C domain-containing protein [Maridesulfovibrio frigidus]